MLLIDNYFMPSNPTHILPQDKPMKCLVLLDAFFDDYNAYHLYPQQSKEAELAGIASLSNRAEKP